MDRNPLKRAAYEIKKTIKDEFDWKMEECSHIKNRERRNMCKAFNIQSLITEYYSKLYQCKTEKSYYSLINKIEQLKQKWEKFRTPGMFLDIPKVLPSPPLPKTVPLMMMGPGGIPANIR